MSVGLYSHVTRSTGTVLTATIYNTDHVNHILNQNPQMTGAYSDSAGQMQTMADPGGLGTESLAGSLAGELERLRFVIDRIVGLTHWYQAPAANLADLGNVMASLVPFSVANTISPSQITANQNDYNPTGLATATVLRLSSDALRNITGIAGGASGRILILINVGSFPIDLISEDAGSTAANRFGTGKTVRLAVGDVRILVYDSTSSRWREGVHGALNTQNSWTGQQGFAQATLTDAATISWDGDTQQCATVTLGGNRTLGAISNPRAGFTYILEVKQDATGSRTLDLSNTIYQFPGGTEPVLSTAANAVDVLSFYYDGSKMLGAIQKAFS